MAAAHPVATPRVGAKSATISLTGLLKKGVLDTAGNKKSPGYGRKIILSFDHNKIYTCICMYLCVRACLVISFILDVGLVDAPAEDTQEECHTAFLIHLPSAVLALIFLARRIQPFLSLVDPEVEFCVPTNYLFSTCWA